MQINNYTPFAGLAWEVVHANNTWSVSAVARARFRLQKSDELGEIKLSLDPQQGELFPTDIFWGESDRSSVRYESDLVSFKPNTDLVLNANAVSPRAKFRRNWSCGVRVYSEKNELLRSYFLNVFGERKIHKLGVVWWSGFLARVNVVPIRYEYAKGGTVSIPAKNKRKEKFLKVNRYNPAGCGIKKIRDPKRTAYTPQILYRGLPKFTRIPPGFGFINRAWKSRVKLAGTYDKKWIKNQHPLPPHDFDPFYNQAAHPELIMDGYLKGGSRIELVHLLEGAKKQHFRLPEMRVFTRVKMYTGEILKEMNIDTVLIDIDGEEGKEPGVYISWRASVPRPLEAEATDIMIVPEKNTTEVKDG